MKPFLVPMPFCAFCFVTECNLNGRSGLSSTPLIVENGMAARGTVPMMSTGVFLKQSREWIAWPMEDCLQAGGFHFQFSSAVDFSSLVTYYGGLYI